MKSTWRTVAILACVVGWSLHDGPVPRPAHAQPVVPTAKEATPPLDVLTVDNRDWQAAGTHGAVVAGGRGAVSAGLEVLKAGGNAADAAAATILALSVTDSSQFCFGGEVPILFYDARTGNVTAISGMGAAPRLATRDHFAARGKIPNRGIEAAAVPAALDACITLLDRFGTMTLAQVVGPTLKLLGKGTEPWHRNLAGTIGELLKAEARAHDSAPHGDRSRGLRLAADAFYRGPIARRIDAWSKAHGGLIRYADLAAHATRIEEPVSVPYRSFTVYKCGVWTQGPALLEALRLLEGFSLRSMKHNTPDSIHLTVEALKLALADRDTFYADPLFADVPLQGLLDPAYALARRTLIDREHASKVRRPGDPRNGKALLDPSADPAAGRPSVRVAASHDTTTCLVADGLGNVVAATPSGWSGVEAGDTGVWLGSRLQSFNLWPGHPNVIEPAKRPRITLSPTLVLRDGKPTLAISVAGGDNQDQMTLQLVLNQIEFGLDPAASVVAPRFMTDHFIGSFQQKPPALGRLRINPEVGAETLAELRDRGHELDAKESSPLSAAPTVIAIDPASGLLKAAGDPRTARHALAY
jgi:gamma-glutamyltranspeptidase/glutathione hydrolase